MSTTPTQVPVSTNTAPSGPVQFSLGTSLNDPNAIQFGAQDTPTSVSALEIPSRLGSLGGKQAVVAHEFPGGYKTIQALGAFPDPLNWTGILLGGNAFARSFQLDTLRRTGQTAYLIYGPWRWQGILAEYLGEARHQNYVQYRAKFEPAVDLTAAGQAQAPGVSTVQSTVSQILNQIQQQYLTDLVLSAASAAALGDFVAAASAILTALSAQSGLALTSAQSLSLGSATTACNTALAIDAGSSNAEVVAQAAGAAAAVAAASGALGGSLTQTTIQVVNPNLVTLASRYLGDASQWTAIAALNGLVDIEPPGIMTLAIPISSS